MSYDLFKKINQRSGKIRFPKIGKVESVTPPSDLCCVHLFVSIVLPWPVSSLRSDTEIQERLFGRRFLPANCDFLQLYILILHIKSKLKTQVTWHYLYLQLQRFVCGLRRLFVPDSHLRSFSQDPIRPIPTPSVRMDVRYYHVRDP